MIVIATFSMRILMLGTSLDSAQYLERLQAEIGRIDQQALKQWADLVYQAWEDEKFVFIFGIIVFHIFLDLCGKIHDEHLSGR